MLFYKKLITIGLTTFMLFGNSISAYGLAPGDVNASSGVIISGLGSTTVTVAKSGGAPFANLGKIRWNQFNVPQSQTVNFRFTAKGQTIINYVDPTFNTNPSLIAGTINTYDPTLFPNAFAGRVFLINPNGISFNGATINTGNLFPNYNTGTPSFFLSTLDLDTSFESIDDNTTDITFNTFTDGNDFANGIYSIDSTFGDRGLFSFGTLKELTFLGNGIAITDSGEIGANSRIDVTFNHANCAEFDNYFNSITAGRATVSLDSGAKATQLTEITITAPNTVPACSDNSNGGVRYFTIDNVDPITRGPNLSSEYQIALCNDRIIAGPLDTFFYLPRSEEGIVRIENQSDYFSSTGLQSIVKVAAPIRVKAESLISSKKVLFLISQNPNQGVPIINANDPGNIYLCGTTPTLTPGIRDADIRVRYWSIINPKRLKIEKTSEFPDPGNTRYEVCKSCDLFLNNQVMVETNDLGSASNTNFLNDLTGQAPCTGPCLGNCSIPPDPAPPPSPTPAPAGGGGGGAAAAIAIPIGAAGAAGIGSLFAAAPLLAAEPIPTPITTVMRPYYVCPRTVYDLVPASQETVPSYSMRPAYGSKPIGAAAPVNQGYYYYPQNTNQKYYYYPQNPGAYQNYYYPQNTDGAAPTQTASPQGQVQTNR